jgi:hypothetical protein
MEPIVIRDTKDCCDQTECMICSDINNERKWFQCPACEFCMCTSCHFMALDAMNEGDWLNRQMDELDRGSRDARVDFSLKCPHCNARVQFGEVKCRKRSKSKKCRSKSRSKHRSQSRSKRKSNTKRPRWTKDFKQRD